MDVLHKQTNRFSGVRNFFLQMDQFFVPPALKITLDSLPQLNLDFIQAWARSTQAIKVAKLMVACADCSHIHCSFHPGSRILCLNGTIHAGKKATEWYESKIMYFYDDRYLKKSLIFYLLFSYSKIFLERCLLCLSICSLLLSGKVPLSQQD